MADVTLYIVDEGGIGDEVSIPGLILEDELFVLDESVTVVPLEILESLDMSDSIEVNPRILEIVDALNLDDEQGYPFLIVEDNLLVSDFIDSNVSKALLAFLWTLKNVDMNVRSLKQINLVEVGYSGDDYFILLHFPGCIL